MSNSNPMPPLGRPYNVTEEEYWYEVPPDERDDSPTLIDRSTDNLPPTGSQESERRALGPALRQVIQGYLDDVGFRKHDEVLGEVFGQFSIGTSTSDREMRFYLGHPDAFGGDLVGRIQDLLIEHFPLWRVVPQYEEMLLGVYPSGVWIRDDWCESRLMGSEPEFLAWKHEARKLHKTRIEPRRRQLIDIQAHIPGLLLQHRLERSDVAFVGTYHGRELNRDCLSVWMLVNRSKFERGLYIRVGDGKTGPLEIYPIHEMGAILPPGSKGYSVELRLYIVDRETQPNAVEIVETDGRIAFPISATP